MQIQIFTDGGSRGNPGQAACAFVIESDGNVIDQGSSSLGLLTNNEAEYHGFLLSLRWLNQARINTPLKSITWKLDSKLVVEQLNHRWKIKEPRMRSLAQTCWQQLSAISIPYTIQHIPREENARADALLNQALDSLR